MIKNKTELRQRMLDMAIGANRGYEFDPSEPLSYVMGFDAWCGWVQVVLNEFVPDKHYLHKPQHFTPFNMLDEAVTAVWNAMSDIE